jgi:hypothetical protein
MTVCDRNSEIAPMYDGSSDEKGPVEENHTAGTAAIVGIPEHIAATSTDSSAVGAEGVQCVESLENKAINTQISYPAYTLGTTETTYSYSTVFYGKYSGSRTVVRYSQVAKNSIDGQFLDQKNGAYLTIEDADSRMAHILGAVHEGNPQAITVDANGVAYVPPGNATTNSSSGRSKRRKSSSHTARISQATYRWLKQNFEISEGDSLPRSAAYNHYVRHYKGARKDCVSASIFGKKFRAVFPTVRSRRLGGRGNTKYHYNGIRIIPRSELKQLPEDGNSVVCQQ